LLAFLATATGPAAKWTHPVLKEEPVMYTRDYVVHRISVIIQELEQLKQLQDNAYAGSEENQEWHDKLNKAIDALYDAQ